MNQINEREKLVWTENSTVTKTDYWNEEKLWEGAKNFKSPKDDRYVELNNHVLIHVNNKSHPLYEAEKGDTVIENTYTVKDCAILDIEYIVVKGGSV